MMLVRKSILRKVYRKRDEWSHKYDFGSLLVIGGSRVYSGSPGFNALAALRSGCDLATIAAPERAANICASFSPDIITHPLKGDYLSFRHVDYLVRLTNKMDAVVIGGGLERRKETMLAVRRYLDKLSRMRIPCVIDADAIHAVKKVPSSCVITPHAREFLALTGESPKNDENRAALVKKHAAVLGCVILLKGRVDIISDGSRTAENKTGNVYMTKGGTGDILAGICGSLLAQGACSFNAACAAAYISGAAGEATKRNQSLLASDVLDKIEAITKVVS